MAEESYLVILFYVIVISFALNESSANGGRLQLKNQIKEMNLFTHASTSTIKDLGRKRKLGENGEDIRLPIYAGKEGNFLVTVSFGTPAKDFNLLFDTGSDVTWIRCQPCSPKSNCDPQIPKFDPYSSSTFSKNIECKSNSSCQFSEYYHDGTSVSGYYIKDTITILSYQHPDFLFACAQEINGDFEGASGLLGLGGNSSLIAQTDLTLLSTFCYCLPVSSDSSGYIAFGVQAFESCQPEKEKLIPIEPSLGENGLTGYYISLTGISIGDNRIDVSSIGSSSSIRAMIDSGTVISRLPNFFYSALKSEFQTIMDMMGFNTIKSSDPLLDTCYNLEMPITGWKPPIILLHFGGKDVELDSSAAVTTMGTSESEICLAFAGNTDDNDLVIIGNQQHRNKDLFFDIHNQAIYFSSGHCMHI